MDRHPFLSIDSMCDNQWSSSICQFCRKPEEERRNYKAKASRRWLALVELSGHRCSREALCPMLGDHTWPLTGQVSVRCAKKDHARLFYFNEPIPFAGDTSQPKTKYRT